MTRWEWRRWLYGLDVPPMYRLVGCVLTEYVNEATGLAWPSVGTLADTVRTDARTVQRALAALVEAGALEVAEKGGGRSKPNTYRIAIPRQDCQGFGEQIETERVTAVTQTPAEWVTAVAERVTPVSPEPYRTLGTYTEPEIAAVALAAPAGELFIAGEGETSSPPDFKARAAWAGRWPAESETYPPVLPDLCTKMVGVFAVRLLGHPADAVPKLPDGTYLDRRVSQEIPSATMARLCDRLRAGKLRHLELAEALCRLGYQPTSEKSGVALGSAR